MAKKKAAAVKAAGTRRLRAAGRKAAVTRVRRAAAKKAASTRSRKAARRKAVATRTAGRPPAPKTMRAFYTECWEAEKPKFIKVMKAVPPDTPDYRPHPRSTSAGDLLWLLAVELHDACNLIDRGECTYVPAPGPGVAASVAEYEKNAAALDSRLAKVDDEAWVRPVRLIADGKVMWEAPLGDMLFGFLFDAIHHRGQLSTYLRPMGAKVPAIYGPSGDDPGM